MTGFATLYGVSIAKQEWMNAATIITVPLFFLLGSMVSALLVERRIQNGFTPKYGIAMSLIAMCLMTTVAGGELGWFGHFGSLKELRHDYLLLALLCTSSGLQNAMITSVSGRVVRTTHLTGLTTDLGIGLVRVAFADKDQAQQPQSQRERRFNMLRMGTILSFILGSTAGATLCLAYGYLGFLLPTGLALYSVFAAFAYWQKPEFYQR